MGTWSEELLGSDEELDTVDTYESEVLEDLEALAALPVDEAHAARFAAIALLLSRLPLSWSMDESVFDSEPALPKLKQGADRFRELLSSLCPEALSFVDTLVRRYRVEKLKATRHRDPRVLADVSVDSEWEWTPLPRSLRALPYAQAYLEAFTSDVLDSLEERLRSDPTLSVGAHLRILRLLSSVVGLDRQRLTRIARNLADAARQSSGFERQWITLRARAARDLASKAPPG